MSIAVRKLITRLTASLVDEDDKAKRKSIHASLEAAKKTLKHVEHTETEESPDEEDEEEEAEEGGNETDREEEAEPPPKDDDEDDEDDDEEEEAEEKSAKALTALAAAVPGKKGQRLAGAIKALIDKAAHADTNDSAIKAIQAERKKEKRDALVQGALRHAGGPRITPAQAKWLGGQKLATVQSYLASHTKAIVNTEERLADGEGRPAGTLSAAAAKQVAAARTAGLNDANVAILTAALLEQEKKGSF